MGSDPSPPLWKAGTNDSASLGLVFLLCRMGKVGPASPGSWEDQMRKDVNFGPVPAQAQCKTSLHVTHRHLALNKEAPGCGWLALLCASGCPTDIPFPPELL